MKYLKPSSVLFVVVLFHAISFQALSQSDKIKLYKPAQQDSLVKVKMTPETVTRLLGKSTQGGLYYLITRTKPGDTEVHEGWDDIAIVRSGHATLKTGPRSTGKENGKTPGREWVGGVIPEGTETKLGPGDFIIIPAMLAHQYIPVQGETFQYWTIKVKHVQQ